MFSSPEPSLQTHNSFSSQIQFIKEEAKRPSMLTLLKSASLSVLHLSYLTCQVRAGGNPTEYDSLEGRVWRIKATFLTNHERLPPVQVSAMGLYHSLTLSWPLFQKRIEGPWNPGTSSPPCKRKSEKKILRRKKTLRCRQAVEINMVTGCIGYQILILRPGKIQADAHLMPERFQKGP